MGPYPPPHGGVQTNLVAIRNYLIEREIPCAAINLTRFRGQDGGGVYFPKTAWGVVRLLKQLDYDVIHVHVGGDLSLRDTAVLLLSTLIPGKRTVFTFHSGGYPGSEPGRKAKIQSLRGFVLRRLDRIIAVNNELVELFRRFGVSRERIRLIPPFAVENPGGEVRLPENIERFYLEHSPVLVTVSGLEPEYDLPLQVEALGRLRNQFPRIGLAIIGGGCLEAQIRQQIDAAPHGEHILMCGDIAHEQTLQAIGAADLFLRTTLYDGDSISVREALHLGTPVIATDNGMRPPGVFLIPMSDGNALVREVTLQLQAAVKRTRLRANSGAENLEAVLELYEDLAGEKRGAGAR